MTTLRDARGEARFLFGVLAALSLCICAIIVYVDLKLTDLRHQLNVTRTEVSLIQREMLLKKDGVFP